MNRRILFALTLALSVGSFGSPTRAHAEASLPTTPSQAYKDERTSLTNDLSALSLKLEGLLEKNDVHAAEALYALERRAIGLVQFTATHDVAAPGQTHEGTLASTRLLLSRILGYEERVKDHAQDVLDRALPGEPGRRLVNVRAKDPAREKRGYLYADAYSPLFRQATPVPGTAPVTEAQRLAEMRADFTAKGGDLKRDIRQLNVTYLKALDSGQLAEWTQLDGDHITITTKGAKHPVIGGGKNVRGAGSMKIYRDSSNEIVLAIVSNSSGNYKPGVSSVEGLVSKLVKLGVPEDRIVSTSITPEEPELVKLMLKAQKTMSKQDIDLHATALRERSGARVLRAAPLAMRASTRK